MKIGIYTPYLDSFGGGERYMLTIAEVLSRENQVDLLFDRHHLTLQPLELVAGLGKQLDLDLSRVNLVEAPLGTGSSFFKRFFFFREYDILVYLTDGSLFYSTAKHSLIHFQAPFKNTAARSLWGRVKLSSWEQAIYNSNFTRDHVRRQWPIEGVVIYPPVEVEKIKPLVKKKQILSVGRFVSFSKSKKHEEMIKTFSQIVNNGQLDGWSLHLAGSVEGDASYVGELRSLAKNLPIVFYPDCSFGGLVKLYGESSIYWHAAGFGEEDPAKMEHFGITTVEAMAGGCVPVVIGKGGQPEIVEDGVSGLLWDSLDQLGRLSVQLSKDVNLMGKLSRGARARSRLFSKKIFAENIKRAVGKL